MRTFLGGALAHADVASPQHHEVFFYDEDKDMSLAVADYAAAGLREDEPVIVIATAPHLAAVEAALSNDGVDVSLARARGAYLTLDAAETLDSILVDATPDAGRFAMAVSEVLDAATVHGPGVRVFGEMVSLLWQRGDVSGAMAIESSWNALAAHRQFSLLCAYPTSALGSAGLGDVDQVCRLHSAVRPPPSYASAPADGVNGVVATASAVFVAVPEAVYAARQFVRQTLTSWGDSHLVWDGAVIISELATNAVIHAGSPFRTTVERSTDIVRIAVEDVGPGQPRSRRVLQHALGGRGLAIVEELSHQWGCDRLDAGKVFWVDLEVSSARPR